VKVTTIISKVSILGPIAMTCGVVVVSDNMAASVGLAKEHVL